MQQVGASLPGRFRSLSIVLLVALICIVVIWHVAGRATLPRVLFGIALTLPLWAPLPGLIGRNRRTFAWATLCVVPYFVLGVTEAIANPAARLWAGSCLTLAFLLFATLIAYLRVTREVSA